MQRSKRKTAQQVASLLKFPSKMMLNPSEQSSFKQLSDDSLTLHSLNFKRTLSLERTLEAQLRLSRTKVDWVTENATKRKFTNDICENETFMSLI